MPHLVAALGDEEEEVRLAAADALGGLGDPSAVPYLVAALGAQESDVRLAAARALGYLGHPGAAPHLVAALGDQESMVRRDAAGALGELGDASAVPQLIALLGDEASDVRRAAAGALGGLGDPSVVPQLIALLGDEASDVRSAAAGALGRLGDPSTVPHLAASLGDEESYVRSAAAEALGRSGAATVLPLLVATATVGTESESYAMALVHLGPADALPVLDRYAQPFRSKSWVSRLRGQALWRLGDLSGARECLEQALAREESATNLLTLVHFHLEQGDLARAGEYSQHALEKEPREALCLLSDAVLLWETGQAEEALEKLQQAQRQNRHIARVQDLGYEHFWGPRALAALEALLAHSAARGAE